MVFLCWIFLIWFIFLKSLNQPKCTSSASFCSKSVLLKATGTFCALSVSYHLVLLQSQLNPYSGPVTRTLFNFLPILMFCYFSCCPVFRRIAILKLEADLSYSERWKINRKKWRKSKKRGFVYCLLAIIFSVHP